MKTVFIIKYAFDLGASVALTWCLSFMKALSIVQFNEELMSWDY